MKGIDVSTYQGYPDWTKVQADGVEFAMIKASQGLAESSEAYLFRDSKFVYNITNAAAAGIRCGVYHYFTAQTEAECDREAEFFLSQIAPYRDKIALYAAVDVESIYLQDLSKSTLTMLVNRFCEAVAQAGYVPLVYTNPDWLRNRLGDVSQWYLWLALWRSKLLKPSGYGNMVIWQWGSEVVDGITGKVDANIGYMPPPEEEPEEKPVEKTPEIVLPAPPEPSRRDELKAGDTVRLETPILYDTGKRFLTKFREYTIDQIDGDRVTISHYGQWRVAVHIDHVEKI